MNSWAYRYQVDYEVRQKKSVVILNSSIFKALEAQKCL